MSVGKRTRGKRFQPLAIGEISSNGAAQSWETGQREGLPWHS